MSKATFITTALCSLLFLSHFGQRRQQTIFSILRQPKLNPLDYAPDFSNDPFPSYPPVHQSDGSNFTAANWRGTRLFGRKGCNKNQVNLITEAWNDFYKLAQQKELYDEIDWSSQAALDIWGHSTAPKKQLSDETKKETKQIF